VRYDTLGKRRRDYREAVEKLSESTWDDWEINGPRTVLWVARFCLEKGQSPMGMHAWWKNVTKLTTADAGVMMHETAYKILHTALTYDQLSVSELACFEVLARTIQMTQHRWKDHILGAASSAHDDDAHLFLGTDPTRGNLCIAPSLDAWIGQELAKVALAAKEQRKAREEHALLRAPKK
jgi:hypothetical protein